MDRYEVPNPFVGNDEYQCFGCDPHNPIGLRLKFERDGEVVRTTWEPRKDLEGYPGVIHGGILATLADEIAGWYGLAVLGKAGVTKSLSIEYQTPARSADGPFTIIATCPESDQKRATIAAEVQNASGATCATASVVYALFSDALARKRLAFPGPEAFRP